MIDPPRIKGAGKVVQALRQEAGMSLNDLAEKLGWDKGRLSKYENSQLGLSYEVLNDIAKALGRRPEQLAVMCLKEAYPKLRTSEVGKLLDKAVKEMEDW